jgi:hypothetical protein
VHHFKKTLTRPRQAHVTMTNATGGYSPPPAPARGTTVNSHVEHWLIKFLQHHHRMKNQGQPIGPPKVHPPLIRTYKAQSNRSLTPNHQFKEKHTDLKMKTQQHRPDHAPHAVRLGRSPIACGTYSFVHTRNERRKASSNQKPEKTARRPKVNLHQSGGRRQELPF